MISSQWKQAVVEMIELHSDALYRTAYRILKQADQAEDICQSAYIKAMTAERQILDHRRLRGWVTQVVVNECLTVLRRRKVEQRALQAWSEISPEDSAAGRSRLEDREFLTGLLEQLDETTRTVVVLRTMHGMSGNEVRDILGCSAASVSKRLHQGLSQLRLLACDGAETERVR